MSERREISPPSDEPSMEAVAYLVSYYPILSHTFIRREVEAVRAAGRPVETFSVRRPADSEILSDADRRELAATTFVLGDNAAIARSHLTTVLRYPRAYFDTLARAMRTGQPNAKARLKQLFYFAEAVRLLGLMRSRQLRMLHVHFSNNAADIARLAAALSESIGTPIVWSMSIHGPTEFSNVEKSDLAAKVHSASTVACISDFCRSQVMAVTAPSEWPKLHVVHMGVDVERFAARDSVRDSEVDDPFRVLFVGRLVPEKGVSLLLDAAVILRRRGVDVQMDIVGAGPMAADLQAGIDRCQLGDSVRLVGPVGQDELPARYAWADAFCLPSFSEGLPVVLMEALLCELPVVTTAIAAIPELVRDGDTGLLVSAGRPDLIADAFERLANDPGLRLRLGQAGRAAVLKDFDGATSGAALAAIFASAGR
jgi:colanic acid/amylovoran biosynthesis glycosyltransferase